MLGWEVIPRIPLGDFSVSPHGVGIAVGYFLGATLMARRARRTGFDEDHAWNAAVLGVLGAIIGARAAYIVGHSDQFDSAVEYLQIYRGGISLVGGLMGGFFAAWLYARSKKLDFARLADLGAPGLAIGTAVGRIGDLVIGDHLGKPTAGFWGWEYQGGELISRPPCDPAVYPSPDGCIQPGMVVHQTALYDAIWALVIFFILVRLDRRPRPRGFLIWTWAALYAAGRIVTDFTRVDKTWFGTGLTGSQLTAIAVLLLAVVMLGRLRRVPAPTVAAAGESAQPDDLAVAAAGEPEEAAVREPPVEDEAAGTGAVEGPPSGPEPPAGEEAAGAAEPEPAPVLVPDAGIQGPRVAEGEAEPPVKPEAVPALEPIVEADRTAGAPVTADPAVQGELVAEQVAEPPQQPEAVPALEAGAEAAAGERSPAEPEKQGEGRERPQEP